ncbi:MAG: D-hexose-6-phosphate mutarotase [Verrucomicrobiia bacterium]|jgi:glucose-6-phosphate 1-epimerase
MQKLPNEVRVGPGRGGLTRLLVETPRAEAEIFLHGAHVTHFQPRGQKPVLFMSEKSLFEPGKPIRGGVPICFPWFGAREDGRPGPAHGFARLLAWELTGAEQTADGNIEINLRLASNAGTRTEWDGEFEADYRVTIGAALGLELRVRNTGSQPMRIEEALHSYLAVSDVRKVSVEGLAGVTYADRVGLPRTETEGSTAIRITAETDRIYLNTQSTCVVDDRGWGRRVVVEKTGSNATVVWNPWIAKAKAMPDFGDEEWPSMLCLETCNVREQSVVLAPGQSHTMGAVIGC